LDTMQLAAKHLDPVNTLMRGFAMIKKDGEIITDPEALQVGDDIDVHLRDSVLTSVIKFKKRDK
ncbi:MAG: hypothetical protein NTU44_14465, partial [Bacteroidetes bacterium]|nr:hypothetical protein [Bacteroidota bacterium]